MHWILNQFTLGIYKFWKLKYATRDCVYNSEKTTIRFRPRNQRYASDNYVNSKALKIKTNTFHLKITKITFHVSPNSSFLTTFSENGSISWEVMQ